MIAMPPAGLVSRLRNAFAALLACLVTLTVAGCSFAPGDETAGPPPNPLLYEIASADGAVEGWMLGTIHALPDDTHWRTEEIGRVIDSADFLLVEVSDLTGRGNARSIYAMLAETPGLPPLAQRVPPELQPRLLALIKRGDLDRVDFTALETWAAAITLARVDATGDPANGVDRALIDEFATRPVRELEGLRGQLSIFDRLPEREQRTMLAAVLSDSERTRADPSRLQRAWLTGDAAAIEASTREGFLADETLHRTLLTDRNRNWAAAIVPMLADAPRPLIAVGTAHLVGPEGLVALIEAQGYRVRRIGAP
ncbi:MAG: TraB/GumN family protein [Erythrobacter sp.]|jgi:uncharacterized protein YbaP (TraB family)|nr:TraB/GumN family protein [Erythrobacter sp.]